MRVLVTGSCGFIGAHVVRACRARNWDVAEVDRRLTPVSPFGLIGSYPVPWLEGIPLHPPLADADAVVHTAAVADISANWAERDNNRRDVVTDYMRTYDLLEQVVRTRRAIPIVFISSSAVYGDACVGLSPKHHAMSEEATGSYPPTSPYAATKLACEGLVASYAHKTRSPWYALRLAQVFGTGYHHGHVADFVNRWTLGQRPLQVLDDGVQRKSAVHVEDVAQLITYVLDHAPSLRQGAYNVAARGDWSVRDTVTLMGVPATYADRPTAWKGDPRNVHIATDKIRAELARYNPGPILERSIESGVRDALSSLGWEGQRQAVAV